MRERERGVYRDDTARGPRCSDIIGGEVYVAPRVSCPYRGEVTGKREKKKNREKERIQERDGDRE